MLTVAKESDLVFNTAGAEEEVCLFIEKKLDAFDRAIKEHEFLEIDGDIEGDTPQDHLLKIINRQMKDAFSVSIDAVVKQDIGCVIRALETGTTTNLYGITRIVGYYSRISNWNKSKIGELNDRHNGRYSVR